MTVVRKLGVPGHEELAFGAITERFMVVNDSVIKSQRITFSEPELISLRFAFSQPQRFAFSQRQCVTVGFSFVQRSMRAMFSAKAPPLTPFPPSGRSSLT